MSSSRFPARSGPIKKSSSSSRRPSTALAMAWRISACLTPWRRAEPVTLTPGIVRQNLSVPLRSGPLSARLTRRADLGAKRGVLPFAWAWDDKAEAGSSLQDRQPSVERHESVVSVVGYPGGPELVMGGRGGPFPVAAVRQGATRAKLAGKSLSGSANVARSVRARGESAGRSRSHLRCTPLGVPAKRRPRLARCR